LATYSTLDSEDLQALEVRYGMAFGEPDAIKGGAANSSFLAQASGKSFVITVLDSHDWNSAQRVALLTDQLAKYRIRVPRIVRNERGGLLTPLGDRIVVIKDYEPGNVLEILNIEQCHLAGKSLARVHGCPPLSDMPRPNRRLPDDYLTQVASFTDQQFANWIREQDSALSLPSGIPKGLTHGDLFPDNIVIKDDGEIVILDWEDAANEVFVIDIGMSIVGLCRSGETFLPDYARAFLDGYLSVRQLTETEMALLLSCVSYATAVTGYFRYLRHVVRFPNPSRASYYREMPLLLGSVQAQWSTVSSMGVA